MKAQDPNKKPLSDPGAGDAEAPIGTEAWAQRWRLDIQGIVRNLAYEPLRLDSYLKLGQAHTVWRLLNTREGAKFSSFTEFCLSEPPWGLGQSLETIRPFLVVVGSDFTEGGAKVPSPTESEKAKARSRVKTLMDELDSIDAQRDHLDRQQVLALEELQRLYPTATAYPSAPLGARTGVSPTTGQSTPEVEILEKVRGTPEVETRKEACAAPEVETRKEGVQEKIDRGAEAVAPETSEAAPTQDPKKVPLRVGERIVAYLEAHGQAHITDLALIVYPDEPDAERRAHKLSSQLSYLKGKGLVQNASPGTWDLVE